MAAKKTEDKTPESNPNRLPSTINYGDHAGAGYEGTTQADFSVPFVRLLQQMSPELDATNAAAYIEDAKAGMMLLKSSQELIPAEGFLFVPCYTAHKYDEWHPRTAGGGFVASHPWDSPAVAKLKASRPRTEVGPLKTDSGTELVETFYMFGYILGSISDTEPRQPVVISFSSTKIKAYRTYMDKVHMYKGKVPLYANVCRVGSVPQRNKKGQPFFNFDLRPAVNNNLVASMLPPMVGDQPNPLLEFGRLLSQQAAQGIARPDYESAPSGEAAGGADPDAGDGHF